MTGAVRGLARLAVLVACVGLLGLGVYWIGLRLSSDAIGMIIGLLFGMLGALPGLMVARSRSHEARRGGDAARPAAGALPQPPVIVVVGGGPPRLAEHAETEINVPYAGGE
jgi:hypothetical protein